MKKITFLIALAASMAGNLWAQDTLWQKVAPRNSYFYNDWIDTTERYAYAVSGDFGYIVAKRFVAKDSLRVYGIAAMMANMDYFYYIHYPSSQYPSFQAYLDSIYPENPTLEHCEESLLLFQYNGAPSPAMQQLGDSLHVHCLNTPVSYWMMSNRTPLSSADLLPKPIYERYFTEPLTVRDTFYAGYTQSNYRLIEYVDEETGDTLAAWITVSPGFSTFCFSSIPSMVNDYEEYVALLTQYRIDAPTTWKFCSGNPYFSMYLFPILTPEPPVDTTTIPIDTTVTPIDTTVVPTDTTAGIGKVDMVNRYVSVSPNPAGDRATVLSSFGLTAIEAYDPQARKLYSAPAEGLKATLDVSAWPRGTVLLHIHTPAGTAVKKLLLR